MNHGFLPVDSKEEQLLRDLQTETPVHSIGKALEVLNKSPMGIQG